MGKGDKKTRKGKIHIGSYGVRRKKRRNIIHKPSLKPFKEKKAVALESKRDIKESEVIRETVKQEEPVVAKQTTLDFANTEKPVNVPESISKPSNEVKSEPMKEAGTEEAPTKKARKAPAKKVASAKETSPNSKAEKEAKPKTPKSKKKPDA